MGQFWQDGRQPQLFRRQNRTGNFPEDGGTPVFLHKKIGTVPGEPGNFVTEIDISGFLENLDLIFRCDLIKHSLEIVVFQGLVFHPLDFPPQSQCRGLS